jgi:DNA-binding SARP family transcriptional activator
MKLQLGLLGGLYVGITGVGEVALTRKNRLVLATLALAGPKGLSRSAVVQLLWGAFAQEQALASLRQALSAARRALGNLANAVAGDGERLWIDQSTAEIDVEAFSSLLASASPADREKALALYKGDLLAGIPLKEDALEEWLRPLRERLRARAIDTLVQLVEQPVAVLQFDGLDDEPARTYLARALTSDTASALRVGVSACTIVSSSCACLLANVEIKRR